MKLIYQMFYPPEGASGVLEVANESDDTFLHVTMQPDGALMYYFFNTTKLRLTEENLSEIREKAKSNLPQSLVGD